MTDASHFAACGGSDAMRYAHACLSQGMPYPAASKASGVNEGDLRMALPGFSQGSRPAPFAPPPPTPWQRIASILPEAREADLKAVLTLTMSLLADKCGRGGVVASTNGILAALPHPHDPALRPRLSGSEIARYVASDAGIEWSVFVSEARTRNIARPRQIAMYLLVTMTGHLSYPAVAKILGRKDHTTIISGVRKIESLIAADPDFAATVARLKSEIIERAGALA